eukprot:6214795-Pleurochrysis_carterae.AAC.4
MMGAVVIEVVQEAVVGEPAKSQLPVEVWTCPALAPRLAVAALVQAGQLAAKSLPEAEQDCLEKELAADYVLAGEVYEVVTSHPEARAQAASAWIQTLGSETQMMQEDWR